MDNSAETQPAGSSEPSPSSATPPVFPWESLDDAQLLTWRLCDLGVSIEQSGLQARMNRLYEELAARGVQYRPPCYLSTEWLCPDRIPAIGIPFYLAHPRLIRLERAMMLEAEGERETEFMQLLRHEAGHAINYAYRLYRRSRWRELFGPISTDYNPHGYRRRPYSRQYVNHLQDHYAQAHPDEDFAETFAVWLTPESDWKEQYEGRDGALRKLEYVDHLMHQIGSKPPLVVVPRKQWYWAVARSRSTLAHYFKSKRKEYARAYIGFYDPVLRRLFAEPGEPPTMKAHTFLSRHRKRIAREVARWARIPKYAADDLIRRLIERSREMNLCLRQDEQESIFSAGVCITALVLEAREQYLRTLSEEAGS